MRNLGQKRTLEIFTEILFPSLFLPGCVAASMHTHTSFSEVLLFKTTVIRISAPVPSEKQTAFFFFVKNPLPPKKPRLGDAILHHLCNCQWTQLTCREFADVCSVPSTAGRDSKSLEHNEAVGIASIVSWWVLYENYLALSSKLFGFFPPHFQISS